MTDRRALLITATLITLAIAAQWVGAYLAARTLLAVSLGWCLVVAFNPFRG